MKNIFSKITVASIIVMSLLTSCVNESYYDAPQNTLQTSELSATKTVQQIIDLANTTSTPLLYVDDDIIEAYVTSNDEGGTFYKSISFQDRVVADGTPLGFSVPINATTLFGKGFTPGRKVYIKLKGLYIAKVYGSLQIGGLYEGTIGRISEFDYKAHLFVSSEIVSEESLVRTLTLSQTYTDNVQNTLVDLSIVQFSESSINRTYYDVDSGGGATNHLLSSSTGGAEGIIRFSSFALFTSKQVPTGSGKIRGVLTKYDTDFQFIVRYESDIQLNQPRFDVNLPIVGNNLVYNATLNEPFTSYTASNQQIFPKYINDADIGSRYWQRKVFSGNTYVQMSSFGGGNTETNRSLFIVPVDMTAANTLSFKTNDGFNNGSCFKVYYTINYVPGSPISNANLVDITSSFTLSSGNTNGYGSSFTSSGIYTIPAGLTGNGFFVFEYLGNGVSGPTTTYQLDDIIIN